MRDILACIGAGSLFFTIVLVLLGVIHERADRAARKRQEANAEQVEHVSRFGAALNTGTILDLAAYRERKANGPSARQDASEPSLPVPTGGRAQSIITTEATSNG